MIMTPPLRTMLKRWHCQFPLHLIEMHPHRRQHDQIELFLASAHSGQIRQAIIEPFDHRLWMQEDRATSKFLGRFDGNDRVPEGHKPAASRPVPAPISSARHGAGGIRCKTGAWASAKEMLS
jgi:hypothetical protein